MNGGKLIRKWIKAVSLLMAAFLCAGGLMREAAAVEIFPDAADENAYYYNAVYWAVENGVAKGRNGYFEPEKICTRAEAVTFLYNLAGCPEVTGESPFSDVADSSVWYYKPVLWALQNQITSGYGAGTFQPYATCNRAMIVTFIRNYAEHVAGNYTAVSGDEQPFPDVPIGEWYTETVRWAAQNGVVNGKGDGKFYPYEGCKRAHIVVMLWNYAKMETPEDDAGEEVSVDEDPKQEDPGQDDTGQNDKNKPIKLPEVPIKR